MQTQRFSDRSSQSRFDAEQSLNARCSELVLMRVYFTQQQQTQKKRKGAKFLDRACVRCGCAIQVADGAIKAAKDAARVDAHKDDKRGRQACDRFREARAAEDKTQNWVVVNAGGGAHLSDEEQLAVPADSWSGRRRPKVRRSGSRHETRGPSAGRRASGAGGRADGKIHKVDPKFAS